MDGADSLQRWRVAANILNKQSRTDDNGWSSSLRVGWGANNPIVKNKISYEMFNGVSDVAEGMKWIQL
jgi:hypothetical protein